MAIVDIKHTQTIEEMLKDGGGSSGGGAFKITGTFDLGQNIINIDASYNEIFDAVSGGSIAYLIMQDPFADVSGTWVINTVQRMVYVESTSSDCPKHYMVQFDDYLAGADTATEKMIIRSNWQDDSVIN